MNSSNKRMMLEKLNKWGYFGDHRIVVDLGSFDVNGTLRDIIPTTWTYIGVDRVPGPNVDIVMPSEYEIPLDCVDIVVSSSCFQYVRNPFRLMKEVNRILIPGSGFVIVCAPRIEKEGLIGLPTELCPNQDSTFDCWRFLKDGMRSLLEESDLEIMEVFYKDNTCWGIGGKRGKVI